MSLRHHEIAEARHRILNPITKGARQFDLVGGKGEMLSRWAARAAACPAGARGTARPATTARHTAAVRDPAG
jgi:hypothetical protein